MIIDPTHLTGRQRARMERDAREQQRIFDEQDQQRSSHGHGWGRASQGTSNQPRKKGFIKRLSDIFIGVNDEDYEAF